MDGLDIVGRVASRTGWRSPVPHQALHLFEVEHQRQNYVVDFHQCHNLVEAYSEFLLNLHETITLMWRAIMTLQTVNVTSLFDE